MLSQPTTPQLLDAIVADLRSVVAPSVSTGAATVALEQMLQLLERSARRAAHEIGWMTEEMQAIDDALGADTDNATVEALAAYRSAAADSLHLADVQHRYHLASLALSRAIEAAFAAEDQQRLAVLKGLLAQRIATEQEILGTLDLVGRG